MLPTVIENENNVVAQATDYTPSLLLRGYDKVTPEVDRTDLLLYRVNALQRMLQRAKTIQSKSNARVTKFNVGDLVLVNTRNERERKLAKTLTPTFSTAAKIVEVLTANRYYVEWIGNPPEAALGISGDHCKRPWPVKYLKALPRPDQAVQPVLQGSSCSTGPPAAQNTVKTLQGSCSTGPPAPQNTVKTLQGSSCSTGPPTVQNTVGQQLWNNGCMGCYLNVLLAVGTLLKSRTTEFTLSNHNLTPIARTFFGTCESWTPGSAQTMVKQSHGTYAFVRRTEW